MWNASREAGKDWVADVCNAVIKDGKIPQDWSKSWLVSVYKGKGDALECGSYWGIKMLEHVLKIFERIVEVQVRETVRIYNTQFGFMVWLYGRQKNHRHHFHSKTVAGKVYSEEKRTLNGIRWSWESIWLITSPGGLVGIEVPKA